MWLERVNEALSVYGHRNWIVIADSAYPAHSSPGIETIVADAAHTEVLAAVLRSIGSAPHLHATVYTDIELQAIEEEDAPGVSACRQELMRFFAGLEHKYCSHEETIARVDEASRIFRVLVIKSSIRIPYTSVFIQLGCGYWSDAADRRLRDSVAVSA